MCGIIGCLHGPGLDAQKLGLGMLEQLRNRGPDEGYLHLDQELFLGVRRLAIVNVAHGRQPAFSEDGKIVAVFNGEIYNHVELKQELIGLGHDIADGSDVETIPHAYEQWGLDFPSHLNGDFAIALWDGRSKRLVLARDRLGIKPLHYARTHEGLAFASEIKALFVHPAIPRKLDRRHLSQLFTFWTGLDTGSPFEGVQQVEAGAVVEFSQAGARLRSRKYWDIPSGRTVPAFEGDFRACCEAFRAELRKSVRLRLQADVEVGTYTSGGIDSAVLNVVAFRDLQHDRTQTFSIAFDDPAFDESEYQQIVVRHLGLTPNQVRCGGADIYRNLPDVIRHTESPIFRTAPAATYLLSRCVRERGIKVVLTGEGADEVAWGYDLFRETKLRRFWSRQPNSRVRPQLFRKLYDYLPQFRNKRHFQLLVDFFRRDMEDIGAPLYSHHTRIANAVATHVFLSPEMKRQIEKESPTEALIAALPVDFAERTPLEKCQYLEMRTLLQGYLLSSQGDRMLSAHGVEGRFPYLDHHVIEFLAGTPENHRLRGLKDKAIIRETFARDLPREIFDRPKFAFRAPELSVFVDDPDGIVRHYLNPQALAEAGIFDPAAVTPFLERLARTPSDRFSTRDNLAFVQFLSTQILHDRFIRRFEPAQASASDVTITRATRGVRVSDAVRDALLSQAPVAARQE
jgi:asparagine synthase (glutamine-hydrolysing)